ncbi:AraC family transcriptional regulator [Pedobacter psychrotolerans]|nr:AraC family transcriptional regulator [Pedobacter psychrotolerans]GGE41234.1 transcription regulator [Pedobacter psychrotolerans]
MIKRYKQFEPLKISDFEVEEWTHPPHQHNHYELIYIKHGSGCHFINSVQVDYKGGEVFLIGPEEAHYFVVEKKTRFIYLKFIDPYLYQDGNFDHPGIRHLEYLIKSRETHLSAFVFDQQDQLSISMLFDVIISLKEDLLRNEQLIWMQALSIAHILQRNMPEIKSNAHRSADLQAVFCYIHKYIYQPEKLKAAVMAVQFNRTKDYIGPYFKKQTGSTLREYIKTYRNQLIKQRLASGRFGLKQIAQEFGLTDESHLSKLMKL